LFLTKNFKSIFGDTIVEQIVYFSGKNPTNQNAFPDTAQNVGDFKHSLRYLTAENLTVSEDGPVEWGKI
jgi:hypothetical protein